MLSFSFSFLKSQVLEQLSVFSDDDIDSAAEALNDVRIITPLCTLFNCHISVLPVYKFKQQQFCLEGNFLFSSELCLSCVHITLQIE